MEWTFTECRLTFVVRGFSQKVMIDRLTLNAAAAAFNVSRKTAASGGPAAAPWGCPALRIVPPSAAQPRRTSSELIAQVMPRRELRPGLSSPKPPDSAPPHQPGSAAGSSQPLRHLHPAPPVVRYEHLSGDLLHLDIKGMTAISTSFHSWRWPPPRRPSVRRLAGSGRSPSTITPPRLLRMLPNQQSEPPSLPARRCRLLRQHGYHHSPLLTDNALLSLPHSAPLAFPLAIQHRFTRPTRRAPRQGRTLHPNRPCAMAYVRHYSTLMNEISSFPWLDITTSTPAW